MGEQEFRSKAELHLEGERLWSMAEALKKGTEGSVLKGKELPVLMGFWVGGRPPHQATRVPRQEALERGKDNSKF